MSRRKLTVKSHRGNYNVFVNSTCFDHSEFLSFIPDESIVIIDARLLLELPFLSSHPRIVKLESTELLKSFAQLPSFIDQLIHLGLNRKTTLVCIGGGSLQDLVSTTAGLLYRGLDWIFIPTTVLSQCDSCIGSKTSLNYNDKKNLIGLFYPPKSVHIYTSLLSSISLATALSGLGDIYHYLLPFSDHRQYLKSTLSTLNLESILSAIPSLMYRSLEIKSSVIEVDEFDKNVRKRFNYGHTFGHAIEASSEFGIPHGVAVAIGIIIANNYASQMSSCLPIVNSLNESTCLAESLISSYFDKYHLPSINLSVFTSALRSDKKNISNSSFTAIIPCFSGSSIDYDLQPVQLSYSLVRDLFCLQGFLHID